MSTIGQEEWLEVNEMRMLRRMCGVTKKEKIRNELITGTRVLQVSKKITENLLKWYDGEGRGTHSDKSASCGHTRKEKKEAEPAINPYSADFYIWLILTYHFA